MLTNNEYCRYNYSNYRVDAKETLKRLHTQFPNLTLEELFKVLDCIVMESSWLMTTSPYLCNTYSTNTTAINSSINN